MGKERLEYISLLRVSAMVMVLIYHTLAYYSASVSWPFHGESVPILDVIAKTLNSIDMPIFVVISGYLFSYHDIHSGKNKFIILLKKGKRLLIPYFIWGIGQILLFPQYCSIYTYLTGMLHLWFLLMLYNVFGLTILTSFFWKKFDRHLFGIFLFSLFVLGNIVVPFFLKTNFLCIKSTFYFLPFFFTGIYLHKYHNEYRMTQSIMFPLLLILFLCIAVMCNISLSHGGTILRFFNQLVCALFVALLMIVFRQFKISTRVRGLKLLDKNSMGIYIIHHIVIWYMLTLASFMDGFRNIIPLTILLLFVCSGVASLLLSILLNKHPYTKWMIG